MENLIIMLKELDIEKNDKETIKEVINFIANKMEYELDRMNYNYTKIVEKVGK